MAYFYIFRVCQEIIVTRLYFQMHDMVSKNTTWFPESAKLMLNN